jgi:hypothetical protein
MRRPVLGFVQIVDALGDGKALFRPHAEARLASALAARQSILDSAETTPYSNLETQYQNAVWAVGEVRDLGDLIIASSFQEDKRKDRLRRRNELINAFEESRVDIVSESISSLRAGKRGVTPFHWETEFPEVFAGLGFNAIVGNPPFLGGTMISTNLGGRYLDWLTSTFEETGNRTDTRDTGVVARELMRRRRSRDSGVRRQRERAYGSGARVHGVRRPLTNQAAAPSMSTRSKRRRTGGALLTRRPATR